MMFAQGTPLEDIQAAEAAWLNPQYGSPQTAVPFTNVQQPMVQQPMSNLNLNKINRLLARQANVQSKLDALDPSRTGRINRYNQRLTNIGNKLAGLGYVPNAPQPVATPTDQTGVTGIQQDMGTGLTQFPFGQIPFNSTYMDNFTPPPGMGQPAPTPAPQNTFGNPFMNLYANQGIQPFGGLGMQSGGLSGMSAYNMANPFLSGNYNFSPFGF